MEKVIIITVNTLILLGLLVFAWGLVIFLIAMDINPFGWPVEVFACISVTAAAGAVCEKIRIRHEYELLADNLHGGIRADKEEYVLCAAIWYKDLAIYAGIQPNYTAYNIDKGIVVTGHRHGQCIVTMMMLAGLRTVKNGHNSVGETEQGFMTSKGRFVDRKEGAKIAFERGQIKKKTDYLFSEDLY